MVDQLRFLLVFSHISFVSLDIISIKLHVNEIKMDAIPCNVIDLYYV